MNDYLKILLKLIRAELVNLECNPDLISAQLQGRGFLEQDEISIIENQGTSSKKLNAICMFLGSKTENVFIELQKICKLYKWTSLLQLMQTHLVENCETRRLVWSDNDVSVITTIRSKKIQLLSNVFYKPFVVIFMLLPKNENESTLIRANEKCDREHLLKELCDYYDNDLNYFESYWKDVGLLKELDLDSFFNPHIQIKGSRNMASFVFSGFSDIFMPGYQSFVLIGQQGSGKSFLVHEMARQWKMGDNFMRSRFDFVLLIRLVEVNAIEDFNIVLSILLENKQLNNVKKLLSFLENYETQKKILFIFDGFDEYTEPHCEILLKLIAKKQWRNVTTVVTVKQDSHVVGDQFGHCFIWNLQGFTPRGIELQLKKFQLDNEDKFKFVSKHKQIFQIPLFLTIFCCIEKEHDNPCTVMTDDFELFDLFKNYIQMLFLRYQKHRSISDDKMKEFLTDFGQLIYHESGPISHIKTMKTKAAEIGVLVNESSGVKSSFIERSLGRGKPNFQYPHKLFETYFKASYVAYQIASDESYMHNMNPQTYLSYFVSGMSENYKRFVFDESWNRLMFSLPYLAHTDDLDETQLNGNGVEFVRLLKDGCDVINLPDTIINKVTPHIKLLKVVGGYITGKINLSHCSKVIFADCKIEESFCYVLSESEVNSIEFLNCSCISFGRRSNITSVSSEIQLQKLTCSNTKGIVKFLNTLGKLVNLKTLTLEKVTFPIKTEINLSLYPKLKNIQIDFEDLSASHFSNLHILSSYRYLSSLIINNHTFFSYSILVKMIYGTNGFMFLRKLTLRNDTNESCTVDNYIIRDVEISETERCTGIFPELTTIMLENSTMVELMALLVCSRSFPKLEILGIISFCRHNFNNDEEKIWKKVQSKFELLNNFKCLKGLFLYDISVSTKSLHLMTKSHKCLNELTFLYLEHYNTISDKEIFSNLVNFRSLKYLNFENCKFNRGSFNSFVKMLNSEKMANLQTLKVNIQMDEDLNIDGFFYALQNLANLQELSLMPIYPSLKIDFKIPTTLKILDLSKVNLKFAPENFFDAFTNLNFLKSLSLNVIYLTHRHIDTLREILENGGLSEIKTLKIFSSTDNFILFFRMLQRFAGLMHLELISTNINSYQLDELCSILENNMKQLTTVHIRHSKVMGDLDRLVNTLLNLRLQEFSLPVECFDKYTVRDAHIKFLLAVGKLTNSFIFGNLNSRTPLDKLLNVVIDHP